MDEKLWRIAQMLLGSKALPPFEQPGQSIPFAQRQGGIGIGATSPPLPAYDSPVPPQGGLFARSQPVTVKATPPGYGVPYVGLHNEPYAQQQPGQTMAQALPFTNISRPMPAAAPPGLLPAMQPGTQIGDNAAYSGVRANWRPEDQAALEAILEEQKRQMAAQNQSPNQWVNPWQAP